MKKELLLLIKSITLAVCLIMPLLFNSSMAVGLNIDPANVEFIEPAVREYPYRVVTATETYYCNAYGIKKKGELRIEPQMIDIPNGMWRIYDRYTDQQMNVSK